MVTRRGVAAHLHLMPDEPRPSRGPASPVLRDATDAVTGHILPVVRAILSYDLAGAQPAADGWEQAVTAAVDAVLELVAPDGEPAGVRGPDGKVTIHGPNPNGPGHGDLIFTEPDLPTTARAILSHYISPAVGMARFDARDGGDVDWTLIEARCAAAAGALVTGVARTER